MVEKIFMLIKQKCNNLFVMLFYKFVDCFIIIDEVGNRFRRSNFKGFKFHQKRMRFLKICLVIIGKIFFRLAVISLPSKT